MNSVIKYSKILKPSNNVLLITVIFYLGGFLASFFIKPFDFGFLTGDFVVYFEHHPLTWGCLKLQFIDYLGCVIANIFLSNIQLTLLCIFLGFPIFYVILIGLLSFSGALMHTLIDSFGFKGLVIYLGLIHLHLEILGALLSIDAFIIFYRSLFNFIRGDPIQFFIKETRNKFIPLLLCIILIFLIAAILEVFWSTWWVYVWTHEYIPWHKFYLEIYNVKF